MGTYSPLVFVAALYVSALYLFRSAMGKQQIVCICGLHALELGSLAKLLSFLISSQQRDHFSKAVCFVGCCFCDQRTLLHPVTKLPAYDGKDFEEDSGQVTRFQLFVRDCLAKFEFALD